MSECFEAAKRGDLSSWSRNYSLGPNVDCFCCLCPEAGEVLSAYIVADSIIRIYAGADLLYEGVVA